jgi:CubicO group peptidase (beta-lactamase class C family)
MINPSKEIGFYLYNPLVLLVVTNNQERRNMKMTDEFFNTKNGNDIIFEKTTHLKKINQSIRKSSRKIHYLLFFLIFILLLTSLTSHISAETYYPENEWKTDDPDLYFDLSEMDKFNSYVESGIPIDSLSIVKNGFLVYNKTYSDYYDKLDSHMLWSVTKSVTSLAFGVAVKMGLIESLDEKILDIFSDKNISNINAMKEAMSVKHLLQMRTGIDWDETETQIIDPDNYTRFEFQEVWNYTELGWPREDNNLFDMYDSKDWVSYVLSLNVTSIPGTVFQYSTGVSHVLSAILQRKTSMTTEEFVKKHIFDPLGITTYHWMKDPNGITVGGEGLYLLPEDMLKIGYLMLNNGTWNGNEIVTKEWVDDSTTNYGEGYGYQWWVTDFTNDRYFTAIGYGGQFIEIHPKHDAVIVITSRSYTNLGLIRTAMIIVRRAIDFEVGTTNHPSTTTSSHSTTMTTSEKSKGKKSPVQEGYMILIVIVLMQKCKNRMARMP